LASLPPCTVAASPRKNSARVLTYPLFGPFS